MTKELPTYMGKPFSQMQPLLPVLKSADVRARLSRMLEVSSQDLDQCENLYMLQGRPRWSATVVNELPNDLKGPWGAHKPKHSILDSVIASVVGNVIDSTVARLKIGRAHV